MKLKIICLMFSVFATGLFGAPLPVGAEAPALVVTTDQGESLDLAKVYAAGPTLIFFYPKADTPGCTKQACNIRDNFSALEKAGITVLGASVDKVKSQSAFKEKYELPFTLIADHDKKLGEAFQVKTLMKLVHGRQSFLILDGKIAWVQLKARPKTQSEDALKAYEKLIASK